MVEEQKQLDVCFDYFRNYLINTYKISAMIILLIVSLFFQRRHIIKLKGIYI